MELLSRECGNVRLGYLMAARVVGKSTLQPFQKGILMNNNALPLLLERFRQYGVEFVLTRTASNPYLELSGPEEALTTTRHQGINLSVAKLHFG